MTDISESISDYRKTVRKATNDLLRLAESLIKQGRVDCASQVLAEIPPQLQPERVLKRCKPVAESFSLTRALVERGLLANVYKSEFGTPLPEWQINTKTAGNEFVRRLGFDVPRIIKRGITAEAVDLEPNTVIKPSSGGNSQGVFSINALGEVFDVGANEVVDHKTAVERILAHDRKRGWGRTTWNIEERVSGPGGMNPVDLKFYSFYGKVGVVTEVQRQPFKAFNNYLRDGQKVPTGKYDGMTFDGCPPTEEEFAVAEAISAQAPVPYLRIDFMRAADGRLLFCEFTPRPGNFDKHNKHIDQLCGRMFVEAECRLLKELLDLKSQTGGVVGHASGGALSRSGTK